jgi:hypothetical protein
MSHAHIMTGVTVNKVERILSYWKNSKKASVGERISKEGNSRT